MRGYVLRSAEEYDGAISDGLYPAKNEYTYDVVTNSTGQTWINNTRNVTYVVGIIGDGATKFFAFDFTHFTQFIAYILSKNYANAVVGALELDAYPEAKAIIDPLQYIASVIFYPFSFSANTYTQQTIRVGYVDVTATAAEIDNSTITSVEDVVYTFSGYANHPYYSTRGTYMNYAPWTRRYLYIPPYGIIELDCTELGASLVARVQTDMITGGCRLQVTSFTNILITELKTQIGVQIQLGQVISKGMGYLTITQKIANITSQVMGGITGGIGTGKGIGNIVDANGAAAGAIVGGTAGLVSGVSSFIKDAIESKIPTSHSVGSMGGIVDLYGTPYIFTIFTYPVDESRNTRGRPLCEERLLSTLSANNFSGYLLIADPDVDNIAATARERDMIASFLSGGFYLA